MSVKHSLQDRGKYIQSVAVLCSLQSLQKDAAGHNKNVKSNIDRLKMAAPKLKLQHYLVSVIDREQSHSLPRHPSRRRQALLCKTHFSGHLKTSQADIMIKEALKSLRKKLIKLNEKPSIYNTHCNN